LVDVFPEIFFGIPLFYDAVEAGRPGSCNRWRFGGNDDIFFSFPYYFSDNLFAFAIALSSRGIDEIHAIVNGFVERIQ